MSDSDTLNDSVTIDEEVLEPDILNNIFAEYDDHIDNLTYSYGKAAVELSKIKKALKKERQSIHYQLSCSYDASEEDRKKVQSRYRRINSNMNYIKSQKEHLRQIVQALEKI